MDKVPQEILKSVEGVSNTSDEEKVCSLCNESKSLIEGGWLNTDIPVCQECEAKFQTIVRTPGFDSRELKSGRKSAFIKRNIDPEYLDLLVTFLKELDRVFKDCTQPITEEGKLYWLFWSRKFNLAWQEAEKDEVLQKFKTGFPSLRHLFFLWQSRTRLFKLLNKGIVRRSQGKIKKERKFYKQLRQYLFGRYGL